MANIWLSFPYIAYPLNISVYRLQNESDEAVQTIPTIGKVKFRENPENLQYRISQLILQAAVVLIANDRFQR